VKGRREFLKASLALTALAATGKALEAEGAVRFPVGIVYTKEAPGRWAGKENLHVPQVTLAGGGLKILTPHPMTEQHFIVKHTLLTPEGKVLGEKTFSPADKAAESSYRLPEGFKGLLWAASFCNLHDLWLREFNV
jgi:superoxide reductase